VKSRLNAAESQGRIYSLRQLKLLRGIVAPPRYAGLSNNLCCANGKPGSVLTQSNDLQGCSIIATPGLPEFSTRNRGVIPFRPRDFLDHAIRDSFRTYSADRSGVSLALHYGQPRNPSVEHRRASHYC
jgi:hypothetical protein